MKDIDGREGGSMTDVEIADRVVLGGVVVDLKRRDDVITAVCERIYETGPRVRPLAIASANLDHVHHFGTGGISRPDLDPADHDLDWLVLLDGVPLVRRAGRLTGEPWPQLAGSDLLPPLLLAAESVGARTGFLGGTPAMHERLRAVLAENYPELPIAGVWSPDPRDLHGPPAAALATAVHAAQVDLLVVGLGKPRQERWISRYAGASGARVLLAFGAAMDFLAGTTSRAPGWMRRTGFEWTYRLLREPRRLARRYCVQGPTALWRLWTDSAAQPTAPRRPVALRR
jgi:N-acetylglucosaminyldiphosphoundecaprenol N-acetyl-beta-D-mannosaminyltransferase